VVLRDTLLDQHIGEQRTAAFLQASHQGLCNFPVLAETAGFFSELLMGPAEAAAMPE
jgi:hypothetical protein